MVMLSGYSEFKWHVEGLNIHGKFKIPSNLYLEVVCATNCKILIVIIVLGIKQYCEQLEACFVHFVKMQFSLDFISKHV
jgi:hypothetical protein